MSIEEYHTLAQDSLSTKLFSLDELGGEEGNADDFIAGAEPSPERGVHADVLRRQLAAAISELPERERLVLSLYYSDELNLKEIGLVLGVSESRVSQIHSQAALRLRGKLGGWGVDDLVR